MTEIETLTNNDAVDIINNEGIGYAVQHYCRSSSFKNPHTRELWNAAYISLKNLEDYLERTTERDIE